MNVAVLGLGVVGSGVYKQIIENNNKISLESKSKINLSYGLVKEISEEICQTFPKVNLTTNLDEILADKTVDCIVEVMGGIDYPYEVIKKALINKKHVVTANKDLMAHHGYELLKLAQDNNCDLYYEASVAGGIPILRTIMKGLASDNISDVKGILNGTSNYILTKMTQDKLSYEEALKQAQALGFAESDPTADVEGLDAARKVAILAMLSYHKNCVFDDVVISGVSTVTNEDIKLADKLGYVIKSIGQTTNNSKSTSLRVASSFVKKTHLLAQVDYEMNAIFVSGEYIGDVMLYGPGAGSNPTATAVMSDVIEVARNINDGCTSRDIILPDKNKKIINDENQESFIVIGDNVSIVNLAKNLNVEANEGYLLVNTTYKELSKQIRDYQFKVYPIVE